jgi:phosphate transport system permease protein
MSTLTALLQRAGDGAASGRPSPSARSQRDQRASRFFFVLTLLPVALAIIILVALIIQTWPILQAHPIKELLTGQTWKPLKGEFGFATFIAGTFWVTVVAMLLAFAPCLLTAIYLSEYARKSTRELMKPVLDLLAAIPSVVYGVWGMLVIVPWVHNTLQPLCSRWLPFIPFFQTDNPTGYSVLAGALVLAVMIVPFIISVIFEIMITIPDGLRHASMAMGATRWQTIIHVVLPQTMPGIIAGGVLGASRALGETMAVLMVVGNVPQLPKSIFDAAYPLPALIANNYGEMMSIPLYDSALMGAALILMIIVLFFNIGSTLIIQRVRQRISYE